MGFVDAVMRLVEDERTRILFSDNARRYAESITSDKINNKIAWRMADTIDDAERHKSARKIKYTGREKPTRDKMTSVSRLSWSNMTRTVNGFVTATKLHCSIVTILIMWAIITVYVVFTKTSMAVKARFGGR